MHVFRLLTGKGSREERWPARRKCHFATKNERFTPAAFAKVQLFAICGHPNAASSRSPPSMSHEPKKPEGRKAAWQEHEIWHAVDRVQQDYPGKLRHILQEAVESSAKEVPRSAGL